MNGPQFHLGLQNGISTVLSSIVLRARPCAHNAHTTPRIPCHKLHGSQCLVGRRVTIPALASHDSCCNTSVRLGKAVIISTHKRSVSTTQESREPNFLCHGFYGVDIKYIRPWLEINSKAQGAYAPDQHTRSSVNARSMGTMRSSIRLYQHVSH